MTERIVFVIIGLLIFSGLFIMAGSIYQLLNAYGEQLTHDVIKEKNYTIVNNLYQCNNEYVTNMFVQLFNDGEAYWQFLVLDPYLEEVYYFETVTYTHFDYQRYFYFFEIAGFGLQIC